MSSRREDPGASNRGGAAAPPGPDERSEVYRCDFCGRAVRYVRRVALDRGYDRLKPHRARYACPDCSDRKDRARRVS